MAELVLRPAVFERALRAWFRQHARDLPWRRTCDPYAILVSEFMLQQTQVVTVIPYFARWMARFPDVRTLAAANEEEVLRMWQGLGYYSRARNLHRTAGVIVEKHDGCFPETVEEMRRLPGLGDYTAGAVMTFSRDIPTPIVDANIGRVLARLFDVSLAIDSSEGKRCIWKLAESLQPTAGAGEFNSALMELGALICLPKPRCKECPVSGFCNAREPAKLPVKRAKLEITRKLERSFFAEKDRRFLLHQRLVNPWKGMWILPPLESGPFAEEPLVRHDYSITRYRVTLEVFTVVAALCERRPLPGAHGVPPQQIAPVERWVTADEALYLPMPSPHRRALEKVLLARQADLPESQRLLF
ncbi:MAG TPA: A/G-specific adenine glycosylase [Chthoniobacterales bacterium]